MACSGMQYVGQNEEKSSIKIDELAGACAQMAGLEEYLHLELYEEVAHEPEVNVELLHPAQTLYSCGLQDGDIIVFQVVVPKVMFSS